MPNNRNTTISSTADLQFSALILNKLKLADAQHVCLIPHVIPTDGVNEAARYGLQPDTHRF